MVDPLVAIFKEWGRRWAERPDDFGDVFEDGKIVENYGERCAALFHQIAGDLGFCVAIIHSEERCCGEENHCKPDAACVQRVREGDRGNGSGNSAG